jgi:hypothetical protein
VREVCRQSNMVAAVQILGPDGARRHRVFQSNGLCLGAQGLDCIVVVVGSPEQGDVVVEGKREGIHMCG